MDSSTTNYPHGCITQKLNIMSTRANIVIKDSYSHQIFYRHSDGYPEGTSDTLNMFLNWVKTGKIRNNTGQAAGWLIVIGALEYGTINESILTTGPSDWKVGAYEVTDCIHGDIEYLYIIDLDAKTCTTHTNDFDNVYAKAVNKKVEA